MIERSYQSFRTPAVYYAEATSYIDAMDYIAFMRDEGDWRILIPPFPTKFERVGVYKLGGGVDWMDNPIEWGFVLHKFHEPDVL